MITVPRGRREAVSMAQRAEGRPSLSLAQRARAAARAGAYGPGGAILLEGTASDPGKLRRGRESR